MFFIISSGEKDDKDDQLESLSRPVSGEKTSCHDDSESVGSARPSSGASGSITGNKEIKRNIYCLILWEHP